MGIETLLLIVIIAALAFALLAYTKTQQSNRYLDAVRDLERQRDRLKSENADLRGKSRSTKTEEAPAKVESKKKKKKPEAEQDGSGSKLKEENYRIKQELKDLRKSVRGEDSLAGKTQQALNDAREEAERLRKERDEAQKRLESALADRAAREREEGVVKSKPESEGDAGAEGGSADSEALAEVERLEAAVSDARAHHSDVERGLRNQIDNARKDAAAARAEARKEISNARRQASRNTKRAENNHKVFLITRNRLLAAEERLSQLDANYTRTTALPTSNQGIEEAVKMHDTREARSAKLHEDVTKAQARIAELEAQLAAASSTKKASAAESPAKDKAKTQKAEPAEQAPPAAAPAVVEEPAASESATGETKGARVRRKKDEADTATVEASPEAVDAGWEAADE